MLRKVFYFLRSALQTETSFTDLGHVCPLFLGHNKNVLKRKSTNQQKKFNNQLKNKKLQQDPFILAMFYQEQKSLFFRMKGLIFCSWSSFC